MNDPQYLAQVGHFLGGGSILLVACVFLGAHAAIKEFWYDMHYELPKQTWGDSAMDFTFYLLGACAGFGLVALAHHLGWIA